MLGPQETAGRNVTLKPPAALVVQDARVASTEERGDEDGQHDDEDDQGGHMHMVA